jgi:hypothetical protein
MHLSHTAFTDLLQDLVMANSGADHDPPNCRFALDVTP